jgi:hypothetical protein
MTKRLKTVKKFKILFINMNMILIMNLILILLMTLKMIELNRNKKQFINLLNFILMKINYG